jgi:dUTP pyrophosphatase
MSNFNINNFINLIENESCYDRFMYLKVYIVKDNKLREKYIEHINNHLNKLFTNISEIDAGFDILSPKPIDDNEYEIYRGIRCFGNNWDDKNPVNKIDFRIKCSAEMYILNKFKYSDEQSRYIKHQTGYYMYPRSSLSKTNLRLANNTGIIDSGYRGNLIGMFDIVNIKNHNNLYDYLVEPYTRLLQICAPSLVPIYVELVDDEDQLGCRTQRGSGGFGSTGI